VNGISKLCAALCAAHFSCAFYSVLAGGPHLLVFAGTIPQVGEFQSMEVGTYRDGRRKHSIALYSLLSNTPKGNSTLIKLQRNDMGA
jgi:hypothetical protein